MANVCDKSILQFLAYLDLSFNALPVSIKRDILQGWKTILNAVLANYNMSNMAYQSLHYCKNINFTKLLLFSSWMKTDFILESANFTPNASVNINVTNYFSQKFCIMLPLCKHLYLAITDELARGSKPKWHTLKYLFFAAIVSCRQNCFS